MVNDGIPERRYVAPSRPEWYDSRLKVNRKDVRSKSSDNYLWYVGIGVAAISVAFMVYMSYNGTQDRQEPTTRSAINYNE